MRPARPFSAVMSMPEAPVNKYRFPSADEGDVGLSGQILAVEPVSAEASLPQRAPDVQLWLRILRTNRAHVCATPRGSELVHKLVTRNCSRGFLSVSTKVSATAPG